MAGRPEKAIFGIQENLTAGQKATILQRGESALGFSLFLASKFLGLGDLLGPKRLVAQRGGIYMISAV